MAHFPKKVLITFSAQLAIFFGLGIVSIVTARVLGPSGRGAFTLVTFTMNVVQMVTNLGLYLANNYFGGRQKKPLEQLASNSIYYSAIASIVGAIGFVALYPLISATLLQHVPLSLFLIGLISLPFLQLLNFFENLILLRDRVGAYNILVAFRFALYGIVVSVFTLLFHFGVTGAVVGWTSAMAIGALALVWYFRREHGITWRLHPTLLKQSIRYGLRGWIAGTVSFLNGRVDLLFVSYYLPLAQVGIYSIALAIVELLRKFGSTIGTLIYPRVSVSSDAAANQFTPRIFRNVLWILTAAAIVAALVAEWAITLIFGPSYREAVRPFQILLPAAVLWGSASVIGNDLAGRGRLIANSIFSLIIGAVAIITCVLLIPRYGIIGAAWTNDLTFGFGALLFVAYFQRITKVPWRQLFLPSSWDVIYYLRLGTLLWRRLFVRRKPIADRRARLVLFGNIAAPNFVRWAEGLAHTYEVHVVAYRFPQQKHKTVQSLPRHIPLTVCTFATAGSSFAQRLRAVVRNFRTVRSVVRQIRPDLINIHYILPGPLLFAFFDQPRIVVSVWGSDVVYRDAATAGRAQPYVEYIAAIAQHVTATSNYLLELYRQRTRGIATHVPVTRVPFGADVQAIVPHTQNHTPPVIGFAKSLEEHYGIMELLKAVAILHHEGVALHLQIAGDGPLRGAIEEFCAAQQLNGIVKILGWQERLAMNQFYAQCDLFAMPSHYESFGVAAVEAAAAGLPVVATNVGGIQEAVKDGETAILVPDHNPIALQNALRTLCEDPALRLRLGRAGQQYVTTHLTWQACFAAMRKVFDHELQHHD